MFDIEGWGGGRIEGHGGIDGGTQVIGDGRPAG